MTMHRYYKLYFIYIYSLLPVTSHLLFVYFITWPDQDTLHDLPLTNENLPFLITDDDTYLQTSIALPRFYHQPTYLSHHALAPVSLYRNKICKESLRRGMAIGQSAWANSFKWDFYITPYLFCCCCFLVR